MKDALAMSSSTMIDASFGLPLLYPEIIPALASAIEGLGALIPSKSSSPPGAPWRSVILSLGFSVTAAQRPNQKPVCQRQLSTKGRQSCRRGKSYPRSLVLFLLLHVAVDYCASCSAFCLYLIAAIDRFDIATCLEIERAYHGLAGVAKL